MTNIVIGSKANNIITTDYAVMVLKPQLTDHLQYTQPDYVTSKRLLHWHFFVQLFTSFK